MSVPAMPGTGVAARPKQVGPRAQDLGGLVVGVLDTGLPADAVVPSRIDQVSGAHPAARPSWLSWGGDTRDHAGVDGLSDAAVDPARNRHASRSGPPANRPPRGRPTGCGSVLVVEGADQLAGQQQSGAEVLAHAVGREPVPQLAQPRVSHAREVLHDVLVGAAAHELRLGRVQVVGLDAEGQVLAGVDTTWYSRSISCWSSIVDMAGSLAVSAWRSGSGGWSARRC